MSKIKPIAVLISDVHMSINTIGLASEALKTALSDAEARGVPLIIAGDLHDTKANLRGECVKALIDIFKDKSTQVVVITGNHDLINERSLAHSLEFLRPYVSLVESPTYMTGHVNAVLIPYYSDKEELRELLNVYRSHSGTKRIIMHQGVKGAAMGEYVLDKSSLPPEAFEGLQVISGHYHQHQTIGPVTYIGTPYTITFAEANDGPKGYQLLNSDFSLTQVPLDLRRHVIIERTTETLYNKMFESTRKTDLIWLKVTGPQSELAKIKKTELGEKLFGHSNFKLDLIPDKSEDLEVTTPSSVKKTEPELLDSLIDSTPESEQQKEYLKSLWRGLV